MSFVYRSCHLLDKKYGLNVNVKVKKFVRLANTPLTVITMAYTKGIEYMICFGMNSSIQTR